MHIKRFLAIPLTAMLLLSSVNSGNLRALAAHSEAGVFEELEIEDAYGLNSEIESSDDEETLIEESYELFSEDSEEDIFIYEDDEIDPAFDIEEESERATEEESTFEADPPFSEDRMTLYHEAKAYVNVHSSADFGLDRDATDEERDTFSEWKKNETFKWSISNGNVIKLLSYESGADGERQKLDSVSGTGKTFVEFIPAKEGEATLTVEVGKIKKSATITVASDFSLDKDQINLSMGVNPSDTITLKAKSETGVEPTVTFNFYGEAYDEEGNKYENENAVTITELTDEKTFVDNVLTKKYEIKARDGLSHGGGNANFIVNGEIYLSAKVNIAGIERVEMSDFWGFEKFDEPDEDGAMGRIENGQFITMETWLRGAKIYYNVEYSEEFPAETTPEVVIALGKVYETPIEVYSTIEHGFARISAVAVKDGYANSEFKDMVVHLDNWDIWNGIGEIDRGKFDNDPSKIATSGLVISTIPWGDYDEEHRPSEYEFVYTGTKIDHDGNVRVYYNGRSLVEGTDFKLTYSNNTKVYVLPENLTDADKKKAPSFTVTGIGNYNFKETTYFSILPMNLNFCRPTNGPTIMVFADDSKLLKKAVIELTFVNKGKEAKLKNGKDYAIYFNKNTPDGPDFEHALTAQQLLDDIKANKNDWNNYRINARGIGNFTGNLDNGGSVNLLVLPAEEKANFVNLGEAKMPKLPAFDYSESEVEGKLVPDLQSTKLIKQFAEGTLKVTSKGKELKYMDDEKYAALSDTDKKYPYYYTVRDPGANDERTNRYPGTQNFIEIVPYENGDDETGYRSNLLGERTLFFTINAWTLDLVDYATKIPYRGTSILAYAEDENHDWRPDLSSIAAEGKTTARVINKATGKELESDRYDVWSNDNYGDVGTFTIIVQGRPDRGTDGRIYKKIKITPRKLTADDLNKTVFVEYWEDLNNIPYSVGGAEPNFDVTGRFYGEETVWLEYGRDFTVSYVNNKKAGQKGSVTLKFKGGYSGTIKKALEFTVTKKEFTPWNSIWLTANDIVYKNKKNNFKTKYTLVDNNVALKEKKDYTVEGTVSYRYAEDYMENDKVKYSKGTEIKDGDIVPAGAIIQMDLQAKAKNENYAQPEGDPLFFSATYIVGEALLSSCKIKVADQKYTGKEVIPSKADVSITYKGTPITDFEIYGFTNNVKAGTASMYIRANGNICGTKKITFKIVKAK